MHWGWVVLWVAMGIWGFPLAALYLGRWLIPEICRAIAQATNTSYQPPLEGSWGEALLCLAGFGIYGFLLHTIIKRRGPKKDSSQS
jgi:hypothetical protein